jgi:Mg2+ and Co2+ transporter CorA
MLICQELCANTLDCDGRVSLIRVKLRRGGASADDFMQIMRHLSARRRKRQAGAPRTAPRGAARGCEAGVRRGARQVSTANLERVRRIKNRLVRLTTRVETLREVLEKILDDDSDMHQMNLTARAMDLLERQARAFVNGQDKA